ncbi:MAG: hypothetical protein OCD76_16480 [Reichenbachiella sp.]
MWTKYKFYILAGLAFLTLGALETMKPEKTVWIESYSKFDKIPYGNYVLFDELSSIFSEPITPFFETLHSSLQDTISSTNLILINDSFDASRNDVKALLEFVNKGNQALIVCRNFPSSLLDTFDIKDLSEFDDEFSILGSYRLANDTTNYQGPSYNINYKTYFDSLSNNHQVLGYSSDSLVNFLGMNYGSGRIFLHSSPVAFTNAFILTNDNHSYISSILSYLPDQPTIWDEHYKARKNYVKQSPLQYILTTDGLRQALYLILFSILMYMIFASKRRQRIIPVLKPKSNSTVDFIETVGQLYYNESDHKDIGMKRLKYFLADIRERYRIDTEFLDEKFCQRLSTLSGVPREDVNQVATNFKVINTVDTVLDERISEQDQLIENYYKKEKQYGK